MKRNLGAGGSLETDRCETDLEGGYHSVSPVGLRTEASVVSEWLCAPQQALPRSWVSTGLGGSQVCLLICTWMRGNTHLSLVWWEWCSREVREFHPWLISEKREGEVGRGPCKLGGEWPSNTDSRDYKNKKPQRDPVNSWAGPGSPGACEMGLSQFYLIFKTDVTSASIMIPKGKDKS